MPLRVDYEHLVELECEQCQQSACHRVMQNERISFYYAKFDHRTNEPYPYLGQLLSQNYTSGPKTRRAWDHSRDAFTDFFLEHCTDYKYGHAAIWRAHDEESSFVM